MLAARCRPCPFGAVKDVEGGFECDRCFQKHREQFGETDPARVVTRSGSTVISHHDSLVDCGCATKHVMRHQKLTARRMRASCPMVSSDEWTEPRFAAQLQRGRARCCASGQIVSTPLPALSPTSGNTSVFASCDATSMGTLSAFKCVERACREEYLANGTVAIEADVAERLKCEVCNEATTLCEQDNLMLREMSLKPGFWRTNEHSLDVRECFPAEVCLGSEPFTSRTTLTEDLCRRGHWGPLCTNCLDSFFRSPSELCEPCTDSSIYFLSWVVPMITIVSILLLVVLLWLFWPALPLLLARLERCSRACRLCLRAWFGLLPTRSLYSIIMPKFKILLGMVQVLNGVVSSFGLSLPKSLRELISLLGAINFVNLPYECWGLRVTYRIKLQSYSIAFTATFACLVVWSRRVKYLETRAWINELNYTILFLF